MPASRRSTPRRGRSSSVVSNVSTGSAKPEPKSPKPPKSPKSPSTPRRSVKSSSTAASAKKEDTEAAATPSSKTQVVRPALPAETNPVLPNEDVPVKLQVIRRDGINIIIGRVKLPTVGGADHAFLLKRFDTNAMAASSMFRLAFPYADGEAEKSEMAYLEKKYDADLANGGRIKAPKRGRGKPSKKTLELEEEAGKLPQGSSGVKLQGTWIPCADALVVAQEYGLLRFAKPLIEAQATPSESGPPILTPSKSDTISTPTSTKSKRGRMSSAGKTGENASPTVTRTRVTKRVKEDGVEEVTIEETKTTLESAGTNLTSAQIEEQIKESQALAKGIQSSAGPATSTSSRKRRAVNQGASAELDLLADDDYESSNAVVRSLRKSGRAVRRRPIVTTAGALSAVGAGALAWLSGGNLDVATQLVQQGVANLQSLFASTF